MHISIGVVAQVSIIFSTLAIHRLTELPTALFFSLLGICLGSVVLLCVAKGLAAKTSRSLPSWMFTALWAIFFSTAQASIVTYRAQDRLNAVVPENIEGSNFRLTGVVDSLPSKFERGVSFEFFVEACEEDKAWCPKGRLIKLSWFNDAPNRLMPGQRWQFTTRLRRPHARLNPHLFDAELRIFEQGIAAQGSVRVREATPARLVNDDIGTLRGAVWWVERARYHLRDSIKVALSSKEFFTLNFSKSESIDPAKLSLAVAGVLVALVVGDQGAIGAGWWVVFNQTGVGHLMSISGLHVTMMAGFVASIAVVAWKFYVWCLSKLSLSNAHRLIPSKQWVRWCAGIAGAWGYTALAGFGIPAQRTCWMVTLAALALLGGRSGSPISVILFTASAVTFLDPWAILSAGFWLSFGAVSAIIYFGSARHFAIRAVAPSLPTIRSRQSRLVDLGLAAKASFTKALSNGWQSQVAATLSLLPIGAAFFSSFALLSPVANAIAIPLVSALVTPLAIVGGMLSVAGLTMIGNGLLILGAAITAPLLGWLHWLASLPGSVAILGKPDLTVLLLATCSMLWLLAPFRAVPWQLRSCGLLALLPIVFQTSQTPEHGEAALTTFDVGQGSSVLIETKNRRLLFDVGPSYGLDSDAGSAVITPYLRARGFKAIDGLVLSHYDADHMGGLRGVLGAVKVEWIASSVPQSENIWRDKTQRFFACQRGDSWEWDGVRFEFMHPDAKDSRKGGVKSVGNGGTKTGSNLAVKSNSSSCVLKVSAAGVTALLTADIEESDERKVLKKSRDGDIRADVLFAPNHGSKTSSSNAFIDAVSPKIAVFQLGFRNRFKYPDPNVLQRYKDRGVAIHRTDEVGAVTIKLPTLEVLAQRNGQAPYWRTRLGASLRVPTSDED